MKPRSCPQCGGPLTTLWGPTIKHSLRGYYVMHVPIYACLKPDCMHAVRLQRLAGASSPANLLAKRPNSSTYPIKSRDYWRNKRH